MTNTALFAFLSNDRTLTRSALSESSPSASVDVTSGKCSWGIGYIQEGAALVRRRPKTKLERFKFGALASDLPSRVVFGCVTEDGEIATDSIPPFRFRRWLHVAPNDSNHRRDRDAAETVGGEVPDDVRRAMSGKSLPELIFGAFIGRLRRVTNPASAECAAEDVLAALDEVRADVSGAVGDDYDWTSVTTNGRTLVAVADKTSLWWRSFDGLTEPQVDDISGRGRPREHPAFRACFLSSVQPDDDTSQWETLERDETLTVAPDWSTTVAAR